MQVNIGKLFIRPFQISIDKMIPGISTHLVRSYLACVNPKSADCMVFREPGKFSIPNQVCARTTSMRYRHMMILPQDHSKMRRSPLPPRIGFKMIPKSLPQVSNAPLKGRSEICDFDRSIQFAEHIDSKISRTHGSRHMLDTSHHRKKVRPSISRIPIPLRAVLSYVGGHRISQCQPLVVSHSHIRDRRLDGSPCPRF